MIDTIRFKIPLDANTYQILESKNIPSMRKTDRSGYKQFSLSDCIYLPKLNGGITLYVLKRNVEWTMYLEFSAPKIFYGHNLFMFYPDGLPEILFKVMMGINTLYEVDLPNFDTWILQRIDLCTVWKLPSDEIGLTFLQSLRDYEYPRKHLAAYDTSVVYFGSSGSVKFYLKHPEFLQHDYKDKAKINKFKADQLSEFSVGCLRFEVELKKARLNSLFPNAKGNKLHIDKIMNQKLLTKILDDEFNTWLKDINPTVMSDYLVMQQLKAACNAKKVGSLFCFYCAYTHSPQTKTILKQIMNKSNINRKLQQLAAASVGLRGKLTSPYTLKVISPLNPNQDNQHLPEMPEEIIPLPDKQLDLSK